MSGGDCPSIRRAVRVLNLAQMSADPIAKVVLAISTIEGLATDPPWTDVQKRLIESAAAWLERTHGDGEETGQVVEAIQRTRHSSIRQRIRKMLASNGLSVLWQDWEALYSKRSRLFHGGRRDGSEHRGDHLEESELHALGQEALTLCGRIVLSMAKRGGDRGSRPSWRAFRCRMTTKRSRRCPRVTLPRAVAVTLTTLPVTATVAVAGLELVAV